MYLNYLIIVIFAEINIRMKYLALHIIMGLLPLCVNAQVSNMYEWKDGRAVVRSVNAVDSITFSIPLDAVELYASPPSEITSSCMTTDVMLTARFSVNDEELHTQMGVCYSTLTHEPTILDSTQLFGAMRKGQWRIMLQALDSDTEYFYRPYLKIGGVTLYGNVQSFVTEKIPDSAVDLGLPSGTLWADRNVGAYAPHEYGYYYSWGMTVSLPVNHWSTYAWYDGVYDYLIKYNLNNHEGVVDNRTHLEPCDDAATVHYGEKWRMPTLEEQRELLECCEWTWGEQNAVAGYYVKGPNGNSIFIPASGYRSYNEVVNAGISAVYWANSVADGCAFFAYGMMFDKSSNDIMGFSRDYGCTVRAVVR